jgi:acetolactate synthase small subunit
MQEFPSVETGDRPMSNVESTPLTVARPDVWAVNNVHVRAHYQILAEAEPDLLCRVLNLFAMQYLIPQQVSVLQQDETLMLDIQLDGLTWHRAQVISEKMRNLINVCSVVLESLEAESISAERVALTAG